MLELGNTFECDGASFTILRLLGKGKGGYSYLAQSGTRRVVYKQMHYEPCENYRFENDKLQSELRDYERLAVIGIPLPRLIYHNDAEQYLVKEYIDGETIAQHVARNGLLKSHIVQMLAMCDILYRENLNIDYFPTNFVVGDGKLFYIDFECNAYMSEWDFEHWGVYFWANASGMEKFLKTSNHRYISENGNPHKQGLDCEVKRILAFKESL